MLTPRLEENETRMIPCRMKLDWSAQNTVFLFELKNNSRQSIKQFMNQKNNARLLHNRKSHPKVLTHATRFSIKIRGQISERKSLCCTTSCRPPSAKRQTDSEDHAENWPKIQWCTKISDWARSYKKRNHCKYRQVLHSSNKEKLMEELFPQDAQKPPTEERNDEEHHRGTTKY